MGADFDLAYLAAPRGQEPDWAAGHRWIDEHRDEILNEEEIQDRFLVDGDVTDDEVITTLHQDLERVQQTWDLPTRDSLRLVFGPYEVLMTGGMTWGDPVSETAELLHPFLWLEDLLQVMGFVWPNRQVHFAEITYSDGTVARWRVFDQAVEYIERSITAIAGQPSTLKC